MKKPTTKQTIETLIANANRRYKRANPAQRRVMICKDALKQLQVRKIKAQTGNYIEPSQLINESNLTDKIVSLQRLLHNPRLKSSCQVCARGALLLSAIRFRNEAGINHSGLTVSTAFIKEFTDRQQEMIESAFERWRFKEGFEKSGYWSNRFLTEEERQNSDKRLELILRNIIRNKGTFKPNRR